MNALDELMSNINWMIHDLVDGDQIDNEEEERLTDVYKQARAELAALRAVVEAARKLQVKMLRVYNTPEYQTVWSIAQSHVGKYEGGNWIDEFDELAAELARVDGEK